VLIAVIVAVALVLAGGGVGWYIWQHGSSTGVDTSAVTAASGSAAAKSSAGAGQSSAPSSAQPIPGGASAPTSASPSRSTPADPEQQALAELQGLRSQSLARVVLDGRWVAQVASKSVGITDPLQTAQNGTHTFFARDILAESRAARNTVGNPSQVYVLWATDFGKRSTAPDGSPYWVTVVDAGLTSANDVTAWCAATYPTLTPAQLADTCAPRQLDTPHD
jgi:hypothetical protein